MSTKRTQPKNHDKEKIKIDPKLRALSQEDLIDRLGKVKKQVADVTMKEEQIKAELTKRLGSKATFSNTVIRKGKLFEMAMTRQQKTTINIEKLTADFGKKALKKYQRKTEALVIRLFARKRTVT